SDEVRIDDDGIDVPISEQTYRDRKLSPPLDELPWQEDYVARPPENLPEESAKRMTGRRGFGLSENPLFGSGGRTSGRSGSGQLFRPRLGPTKR
ncbi:MAG TPA: hypothetical protein VGQ90_08535, partial [Stellaceae bacterium]|nr:hypothetical protein [Stellaceae bacterium]